MGFGKFLAYVAGGAVAVIAAPIVLPVAAAAAATAGVAAAGAATAAGAAAVGAAAAAGTAVTGAAAVASATAVGAAAAVGGVATAAGTAAVGAAVGAGGVVAGTGVGTAISGAMAAVGTGIGAAAGSAAGAVGAGVVGTALGSVATVTGTTAGAAAVGTIATSGAVGIATGATGAKKMKDANEILEACQKKFKKESRQFEKSEAETQKTLEELGALKVSVWADFSRFSDAFEKIKNRPVFEGVVSKDELSSSEVRFEEIVGMSVTANEILKTSATAAGAGVLAGIAAYGGTMSFGIASTGTAIGTLSGAAATNATLAALGGGALAANGLGMAGGTVVLGGMVAAPVAAVGGIFLALKGSENLDKAMEVKSSVDSAVYKMRNTTKHFAKIIQVSSKLRDELLKLHSIYLRHLGDLEALVKVKQDYSKFSPQEKQLLEKNILLVKLLKEITCLSLFEGTGTETLNESAIDESIIKIKSLNLMA